MQWSPILDPDVQAKMFIWPLVAYERSWTESIKFQLGIDSSMLFKEGGIQPFTLDEFLRRLKSLGAAKVVISQAAPFYKRLLKEWGSHLESLKIALETIPGFSLSLSGKVKHKPTGRSWSIKGELPARFIWEEVLPEVSSWLKFTRPGRVASVRGRLIREAWYRELRTSYFDGNPSYFDPNSPDSISYLLEDPEHTYYVHVGGRVLANVSEGKREEIWGGSLYSGKLNGEVWRELLDLPSRRWALIQRHPETWQMDLYGHSPFGGGSWKFFGLNSNTWGEWAEKYEDPFSDTSALRGEIQMQLEFREK